MPNLALVSRVNVLTAMRDHDLQGPADFLATLGFEEPGDDVLVERGKRYDARALLAYAHGKATGDYLTPDQVPSTGLTVLTGHGFTVASRADLDRAKAGSTTRVPGTRTRAAAAPRATTSRTKPEPVVKLCPTCFTQLSMAGTCDYCE
ncbi:MAG: hypothetical protein JWQ74_1612 [Marmoricola sp.]|nr:hypothetical protein [Marmoricola sp.]